MSWLITGGCGFVGTNLADALLERGDDVAIVDNLSRLGARENLTWLRSRHGGRWPFFKIDVRDAAAIDGIVGDFRPSHLAHLAGQVAMTTSLSDPRLDFETNAGGTFNVLEAVRLHSPKTDVYFSSTNKVYGSLESLRTEETPTRYTLPDYPHGLDESLPLDGSSPYGCSKLSAEQYCRDYFRMFGVRTVVFRHSSMYGGRQFATFDQGWIGWFCQKALELAAGPREPVLISGDGKQVRDVLHATDLVRVYLQAADHIGEIAGRIYNIGGGMANSLSLVELFALLGELTGTKITFESRPWRAADQKVFVADYRSASADFGWRPQIDHLKGLREALDWTRQLVAA
jgi:CDP-paratose 2-epimerase